MDNSKIISGKTEISEKMQNFIESLVREILLKGKAFDNSKKNSLKLICENEGLDYFALENGLSHLFIILPEYFTSNSLEFKDLIEKQASECYINPRLLKSIAAERSLDNLAELENKHREIVGKNTLNIRKAIFGFIAILVLSYLVYFILNFEYKKDTINIIVTETKNIESKVAESDILIEDKYERAYYYINRDKVNFRTFPHVRNSEILMQLNKGQMVEILKREEHFSDNVFLTTDKCTFIPENGDPEFLLEKNVAVSLVGSHDYKELWLVEFSSSSKKVKGYLKKNVLTKMPDVWCNIRANGETGWVLCTFID